MYSESLIALTEESENMKVYEKDNIAVLSMLTRGHRPF